MAIGGEKDISIAGLELSSEGIIGGLGMAIRAVTIVIATYTFARVASIGGLSSLFARLGVRELGFLLGVALNLLPLVQRTSANALLAVRLRGGFRRNRLRSLQRMAVTILVNSLRYSDDIVYAAESRAFGGVKPNKAPIVISKADRVLLLSSMMVCAAAIVLKSQWG
ncbi:MAG: energy-coupling factor transporter transmembrane component T [Anaerolineae bacterium]